MEFKEEVRQMPVGGKHYLDNWEITTKVMRELERKGKVAGHEGKYNDSAWLVRGQKQETHATGQIVFMDDIVENTMERREM